MMTSKFVLHVAAVRLQDMSVRNIIRNEQSLAGEGGLSLQVLDGLLVDG